jgi:hypothetical protein
MNLAKISGKLNDQIRIFSGKVSQGLPKVGQRFVAEMLYGLACEQSLHLSKIARCLSEKIPLIKTINRLSFELSRPGLWEKVTQGVLQQASQDITVDSLLILDLSDIAKPYAKRMEYLGRVHDGSCGQLAGCPTALRWVQSSSKNTYCLMTTDSNSSISIGTSRIP